MKRQNRGDSFGLAHSYTPEIGTLGGKNPFAGALLTLSDDFLRENRERIMRLPEKHSAEFFACLSEALPPVEGVENMSRVVGIIEPIASGKCVLLERDATWAGDEQTCRLTDDFGVSGAELKKIIMTNPEKQNSVVIYNGGGELGGFDLSAVFEVDEGAFVLYFDCSNMLYRLSKGYFMFSATDLDSGVYANPDTARWFIQGGEEPVPVSVEIVPPGKLALKADGELDFKAQEFTIGVEILNKALLPHCNFINPIFSFGTGDNLKPDLIIRNGEARETPFFPFGCPLEEKSDFFVACDKAFSKRGARVILWLDLHYEEFYQSYDTLQFIDLEAFFEDDEKYAKAIKKAITPPKERKCKADKISFHYFNGKRFVLLPESRNHEHIFHGREKCEFFFTVPDDMDMHEIGGVSSYWIRVCLEDAENLYYRPCKMLCPQINNIQISYGASLEPRQIKRVTAAGTQNIQNGSLIYENRYGEEPYFYMGFDGALEGKLTLFINTEQNYGIPAVSGEWEVSAEDGFAPVDTVDDTESFSYSGRITFDIPKGAKKSETCFSKDSLYWLRTPVIQGLARYPAITAVYINAADFSLNGDCSKGDVFVLKEGDYQGFKAVAITNSSKTEWGEDEKELLKHRISNAGLMINETDISKTLLMRFPALEEIKCVFDNSRNLLSVYPKFKGTDQEECFNRYAIFIKNLLIKACDYNVRILRPVRALMNIRVMISGNESSAAILREKLRSFLDYQSGGYSSRGWKIGEFPDEGVIKNFLDENGANTSDLVISAGVYASGSKGACKEYMITDLMGGFYALAAGELMLICEERYGTDNT